MELRNSTDGRDRGGVLEIVYRRYATLTSAAAVLGAVAGLITMLVITLDVVWRMWTGRSVPGLLELSETLLVVIVFLSIAYAERVEVHVRTEVLTRKFPRRLRLWTRVVVHAASASISLFLAWATTTRALDSFASAEYQPGLVRFPLWPARIVISIGFILLTIEFALKLVRSIASRDAGESQSWLSGM